MPPKTRIVRVPKRHIIRRTKIVRIPNQAYNSIKHKHSKRKRRTKVTQIIAALCKDKKKLVLVSDRMVSSSDDTLHFEYDEAKLQAITEYAVCLESGTMHEPEIITDARIEIAGRQNIRQIADILAKHYRNSRIRRLEMEILSRYGLTSFEDFYNKQQLMHDNTHKSIMEDLDDYEFNLDIMLTGIDRNLCPHIYLICEPGTPMSFDEVGFCCKGSGETHADPVFAFYGYNPSMSVEEVLYISYVAKKRAQMAGGVGNKTDAWIMDTSGCHKVKQETLDKLDERQTTVNLADLLGDVDIKLEEEPELPPS